MIAVFNVDSRLSVQLNLAHVARNLKSQYPFNSVQVKIHEGSPEGIRVTMDWRKGCMKERNLE